MIILLSFDHREWFLRSGCKSDGWRNSLPGLRKELPCAAMAQAKSIHIERRIFELKAAAASVFWNLKIDFFGTGHFLNMMLVMVLMREEYGITRGSVVLFEGFVEWPLRFGGDVAVGVVSSFDWLTEYVWAVGSGLSLLSSLLVVVSVVDLADDMLVTKFLVIVTGMLFLNGNVSSIVGGNCVLVKLMFNNIN